MRISVLTVLSLAFLLNSCGPKNGDSSNSDEGTSTGSENIEAVHFKNKTYCYTTNGDSIVLEISNTRQPECGSLFIQYAGKDSNTGTLADCSMRGDTLFAKYAFMSEGKESFRDVAFALSDNVAQEGFGAQLVDGNTARFANPNKLSFNSSPRLSGGDCK